MGSLAEVVRVGVGVLVFQWAWLGMFLTIIREHRLQYPRPATNQTGGVVFEGIRQLIEDASGLLWRCTFLNRGARRPRRSRCGSVVWSDVRCGVDRRLMGRGNRGNPLDRLVIGVRLDRSRHARRATGTLAARLLRLVKLTAMSGDFFESAGNRIEYRMDRGERAETLSR